MKTEKKYILEILEHGMIQLLIQTVYYKKDGSELTRENWRTVLTPLDLEYAEELLPEYYLDIVKQAWTKEVVELYQLKQKEKEEQWTTEESGF